MNKVESYQRIIYPLIEKLKIDPETAHEKVLTLLRVFQRLPIGLEMLKVLSLTSGSKTIEPNTTEIGGLRLNNRIILAEGFDKNGIVAPALLALGFGSIIVGSVTERAQTGNSRPRIFRSNGSLLNHVGLPSMGAVAVAGNLEKNKEKTNSPIGISIALNRDTPHGEAPESYARCLSILYDYGDYFAINASSPNTPGLRNLLAKPFMQKIIDAMQEQMAKRHPKPLLIKLSPDAKKPQVDEILELVSLFNLTGVIATNTSSDPDLKAKLNSNIRELPGGVSGQILRQKSTDVVSYVRSALPESVIIGIGGVNSLESAVEKRLAGADLIGLYSSLIFNGPSFPSQLAKQLAEYEVSI